MIAYKAMLMLNDNNDKVIRIFTRLIPNSASYIPFASPHIIINMFRWDNSAENNVANSEYVSTSAEL